MKIALKSKRASGFTLIELIIVIIIIGILAAIAIPRFINQTSNARIAALNGLVGAINTAAGLGQAQYRAEGNSSNSTATTVTMDGSAVTVTAGTGFPVATAAGIGTAIRTLSGFTATYAGTSATFDFSSAAITNCNVTYNQTTGIASATTTGC